MSVVIGDRGDNLHHVDIDFFRIANRLRPDRPNQAPAFHELGDHADLVRDDPAAGFPRAFKRRRRGFAHLVPVDIEEDAFCGGQRREAGAKRRRAAEIGVGRGKENLERRCFRRLADACARADPPAPEAASTRQSNDENGGGPHYLSGTSGSNGPSAVAAAT